jgi:hypothetical protein
MAHALCARTAAGAASGRGVADGASWVVEAVTVVSAAYSDLSRVGHAVKGGLVERGVETIVESGVGAARVEGSTDDGETPTSHNEQADSPERAPGPRRIEE